MLNRPGARFLIVGLLAVMMAIPLFLVGSIIDGRLSASRDVQDRVSREWGGPQTLSGLRLVVPVQGPVVQTLTEMTRDPQTGEQRQTERQVTVTGAQTPLVILPEALDGTLAARITERRRGIFTVPVYTTDITLDAGFAIPDVSALMGTSAAPVWDQARIELGLTTNNGIRGETALIRGNQPIRLEPMADGVTGIAGPVGDPRGVAQDYRLTLTLNGAEHLMVVPVGRTSRITMSGDWPHPSFGGAFLPDIREVGPQGYNAQWTIPHLARPLPQVTRGMDDAIAASQAFGLEFYQPNDIYQQAYRATTYSILLIAMTFLTVLLTERGSGHRPAHPVQYILVGLAQSVFVLLIVAYAEHIGFARAYLGASTATILLLALFSWAGLKLGRRVWVLTALLTALYAVMYLILHSSDYALLAGSTLAFIAIAATMIITRNEDWYGPPRPPLPEAAPQPLAE